MPGRLDGNAVKVAHRMMARSFLAAVVLLGVVAVPPAAARGSQPAHTSPAASPARIVAYVRVDQVGYATGASKRAYLMTHRAIGPSAFAVTGPGGAPVFWAQVGADLGAWSARFAHVFALDFDAVTTPGTYRLVVAGPSLSARSPSFRIGSGADLYAQPLANALAFYRAQRDGPDFVASALRTRPGHLNDAHAMTFRTPKVDADGVFAGDLSRLRVRVDASGGWWDAGDYLKFVHTTAYTDALLLAGVRDFPDQMGAGAATSDFTAEARFGAEWLLRMWDDATQTFYYQVGIGSGNGHTAGDHDVWRLPQADDTYGGHDGYYRYIRHRPVFALGSAGSPISPNLAGRDAAALALASQVYRASDPAFADRCLTAAVHIFDLADTEPAKLVTAIPFDYYPETEWRDDMELGATELARALGAGTPPAGLPHDAAYYLQQAAHWAQAYISGPNDAADTLNLYDVSGLAHYELWQAIAQAGDPAGLEVTRADLLADLGKQLSRALAQGAKDPFGFGFTWGQWDTTTHGAGLAVMAAEYDELAGSAAYAVQGGRWLDNILGANAWGTSLIVGDGTTFPTQLQHQVANMVGTLTGKPPVLLGAAVEGPNSNAARGSLPHMRHLKGWVDRFRRFNGHGAEWRDFVEAYSNTEPAIDLTATTPLAFAWLAGD